MTGARPWARADAVGWCALEGRGAGGHRWLADSTRGRAMALLLCLGMTAALARGCLHCHNNFSEKFSFYRHHVNLKSWWVGDIPVSGALLTDWRQDTMRELHLAVPAEITRENLEQVARTVFRKMDQLYQGKMYFPGYFPNELRAIFREQVHLIQNAVIKSHIDCQRHCGIYQYQTISCHNCSDSHVVCFGYNCESSAQWERAVRGLLLYISNWHKQDTRMRTTPAFLIAPSISCLEPQRLANLTLENASECLTLY